MFKSEFKSYLFHIFGYMDNNNNNNIFGRWKGKRKEILKKKIAS